MELEVINVSETNSGTHSFCVKDSEIILPLYIPAIMLTAIHGLIISLEQCKKIAMNRKTL